MSAYIYIYLYICMYIYIYIYIKHMHSYLEVDRICTFEISSQLTLQWSNIAIFISPTKTDLPPVILSALTWSNPTRTMAQLDPLNLIFSLFAMAIVSGYISLPQARSPRVFKFISHPCLVSSDVNIYGYILICAKHMCKWHKSCITDVYVL